MSLYGELAQLGEHLPCTQGVKGSIPLLSTKESLNEILFDSFNALIAHQIWKNSKFELHLENWIREKKTKINNEIRNEIEKKKKQSEFFRCAKAQGKKRVKLQFQS